MHTFKSLLDDRRLFHGVVRRFRELHDLPVAALSPVATDEELVRAGILTPDRLNFTDAVGLSTAYACAEWHRQILEPDEWAGYVARIPVERRCVLDVGCGIGATAMVCVRRGARRVIGADFDLKSLTTATTEVDSRGAAFVQADAHALPFPDQSFDVVICRVSVNYMNVRQAVAELCRVTRPRGQVCVIVHRVWYYLSMLRSPRANRARYGRRVLLNSARAFARGRQRGREETFITARQLRRQFKKHGLVMQDVWTPFRRCSYLGAVFSRPAAS